jgi:hypothetical protein
VGLFNRNQTVVSVCFCLHLDEETVNEKTS